MGGDRNIGRCRVIRKKIEMDDEKLIDCVRRNPSLYELDHKQYGSGVSRAKTWKAIGAELKRHPLFCKKRWGNIRDNYKKAMKKYNSRLAQGYTKLKKYKFCDKLDFLENHLDENIENKHNKNHDEQCSNETSLEVKCEPDIINPEFDDNSLLYDNSNNNFNHQDQNNQYYDDYYININQPIDSQYESNHNHQNRHQLQLQNHQQIEDDTTTEEFDNYSQADTRISEGVAAEGIDLGVDEEDNEGEKEDEDDCSNFVVGKQHTLKLENSTHLGLRKRKRKLEESATCEVSKAKSMRYIVERVEEDRFVERHPVDAFLSGIAPTLKSLSPYYLSLAKTQIYSIVQEYEMAMIMEQRNENHHRV
ncbi:uncharacterized protein LOC129942673 [Eupeodes corollae]|uniref:uncharacterized protein LOC129942673 n=1 Tax=Eupeodes corollae TaxID=290404 RepID=UPI0024903D9C|nr:uncharacterized protein LOC129942673 [Eupeodes corollae]XP_055907688.1 uncharacterized protein LOC129942673 [Eupeodes corollae]